MKRKAEDMKLNFVEGKSQAREVGDQPAEKRMLTAKEAWNLVKSPACIQSSQEKSFTGSEDAMRKFPLKKGKGSWTPEEDKILVQKVNEFGRSWARIAKHLPGRIGKQCRERYINHLDPQLIKKGIEWSQEEENILMERHMIFPNKWVEIVKGLRGRSDNDAKNHWHSTMQRKYGHVLQQYHLSSQSSSSVYLSFMPKNHISRPRAHTKPQPSLMPNQVPSHSSQDTSFSDELYSV